MSDYIKREDAIAVIYGQHIGGKEACENARPNTFGADLREIVFDIEDIPAADVVERKRGEWIWDDEGYHCSECFFHAYGNTLECMDGTYAYCPNCGADMRT